MGMGNGALKLMKDNDMGNPSKIAPSDKVK